MCRNIKTLANFEPPATDEEIRASALQFVRKLSGTTHPSRANEPAFHRAVDEVADVARRLIDSLTPRTGRLFFTNIAEDHPFECQLRYLASWELIGRTEQQILAICSVESESVSVATTRDVSGLTYLVDVYVC